MQPLYKHLKEARYQVRPMGRAHGEMLRPHHLMPSMHLRDACLHARRRIVFSLSFGYSLDTGGSGHLRLQLHMSFSGCWTGSGYGKERRRAERATSMAT